LHGLCTYLAPLGISCVVCTHRHVHTHSRVPLLARSMDLLAFHVLCVHTDTCTHTVECRYLHGLCTYLAPLGISCVVCTHRHVHTHSRGPLRARTVHLPFAPPPLLLQVHNRLAAVLAAATTRIRMSGYYDLWTSMYQYAVRFSFFLTPLTFFLQRKICYFYCKERVGLNWGILLSLAILTDTCCKV